MRLHATVSKDGHRSGLASILRDASRLGARLSSMRSEVCGGSGLSCALRRRGGRRRVEVDIDLAVADLGLEGLERDEAGRLDRLAARHVKLAEVEAALDLLAVDGAVGEIGHAVRAARLGRVIGAVDVVDRDELVADLAADDAVLGYIGGGADLYFRHGLLLRLREGRRTVNSQ